MKRLILKGLCLILVFLAAGAGSALYSEESGCSECIAIYGDSRTNSEVHQTIINGIIMTKPGIVFHLGDAVSDGANRDDWDTFDKITRTLRQRVEFYPVYGNHEGAAVFPFLDSKIFQDKVWYALERHGVYFIVLDSNLDLGPGSAQYTWLETELRQTRSRKVPVIILLHRPIFSIGRHPANAGDGRDLLLPLIEKYKVTAVFSSHDHNYQRFFYRGTYFVVSGGGGAPLYGRTATSRYCQKFIEAYHFCSLSIRKRVLYVSVYTADRKRIDEFKIKLDTPR